MSKEMNPMSDDDDDVWKQPVADISDVLSKFTFLQLSVGNVL